jgi:hypothetical protein
VEVTVTLGGCVEAGAGSWEECVEPVTDAWEKSPSAGAAGGFIDAEAVCMVDDDGAGAGRDCDDVPALTVGTIVEADSVVADVGGIGAAEAQTVTQAGACGGLVPVEVDACKPVDTVEAAPLGTIVTRVMFITDGAGCGGADETVVEIGVGMLLVSVPTAVLSTIPSSTSSLWRLYMESMSSLISSDVTSSNGFNTFSARRAGFVAVLLAGPAVEIAAIGFVPSIDSMTTSVSSGTQPGSLHCSSVTMI